MAKEWQSFTQPGKTTEIQLRNFSEVLALELPADEALLGNRYLCRKGALMIVGPSGIGKSSSSVQMAMLWALGKEAFGIHPARPLCILMVQAENDDGDLKEMVSGVMTGVLRSQGGNEFRIPGFADFGPFLSPSEIGTLDTNLHFATVATLSGDGFIEALKSLLQNEPCDILWIDPLMAFLGGDPTNTEKLVTFLRQQLNTLLHEHNIAAVISHHTPKITNRDTSAWSPLDFAYSGAGGADITNWARAILAIHPTVTQDTYKFIAAKRGKRVGWKDPLNQPELCRLFRHSKGDGLYWEPGDAELVALDEKQAKAAKRARTLPAEPIIRRILTEHPGGMDKTALIEAAKSQGAGQKAARAAVEGMTRELQISKEAREGTRPRIIVRLLPAAPVP